jgi:hypothetical protein
MFVMSAIRTFRASAPQDWTQQARNVCIAGLPAINRFGERIGDNALIENAMEDRGIELRLSVPVL